jgi:integrase
MAVKQRTRRRGDVDVSVWVIDLHFRHPDGRRERIRCDSPKNNRRDAEAYERQIIAELTNPKPKTRPERKKKIPTLSAFYETYLDDYAKVRCKPSDADTKKRVLEKHLLPVFGRKKLSDISRASIDAYVAKKRTGKKKYKAKTINNHLGVLASVLRKAVEWDVIDSRPSIELLKVAEQPFEWLNEEEEERLLEASGEWHPMILLALRTGMRLGELRAVHWGDIDLKARKVIVRRSGYGDELGPTKGDRIRSVPLTADVVSCLDGLPRRLHCDLVFHSDGQMLTDAACEWGLRRSCTRAGIKRVTWHPLRHTFASRLAQRGAPMKAIQELLGHRSLSMTLRYSHLAPSDHERAVAMLESSWRVNNASTSKKNGSGHR